MKRLRGTDAFTIYSESATSPFVTLKVAIYRLTDPGDTLGGDELRRFVRAGILKNGGRKAGLRILRVPLDIHHPVWVYDPGFSPDNHIHRAELPAPGGKAELCTFLSDLMGRPLDADKPPWEIWILDGLEEGRVGMVFRVHHALADGKTVADLITRSHSSKEAVEEDEVPYEGEPLPGTLKLVGNALADLAKSYTVELPHFYRHLQRIRRASTTPGDAEGEAAAPFSAPYTRLNGAGGRDRMYWYESFPLADFRALSKSFGCTINTLVLGVCSEALRQYLLALDDLPGESLVAAMPIADKHDSNLKVMLDSDILNNNLAVGFVPLHQNIAGFSERLEAIGKSARATIDHVRQANGRRFDNYLDFLPGTFIRVINAQVLKRIDRLRRAPANVVISNVPGPREPLYALGGRLVMEELLSTGNLADGGHLNITVWSYLDRIAFSLYMRKSNLPGPQQLGEYLRGTVAMVQAQYPAAGRA